MVSSPPSPVVRGSWPSKEPSAFSQEPKLSCLHFFGTIHEGEKEEEEEKKGEEENHC